MCNSKRELSGNVHGPLTFILKMLLKAFVNRHPSCGRRRWTNITKHNVTLDGTLMGTHADGKAKENFGIENKAKLDLFKEFVLVYTLQVIWI